MKKLTTLLAAVILIGCFVALSSAEHAALGFLPTLGIIILIFAVALALARKLNKLAE